ncbi:MAG: hypothetical protein WC004_01400 [Candidatus Absconditabacterales bacterium]
MQRKTKRYIVFVFAVCAILPVQSDVFVYAQDLNTEEQSCAACAVTPPDLMTYTRFVRAVLDALQSTSRVDFDKIKTETKQAQVNILTDYKKQETDSYFGTIQKEGRVLEMEGQSARRAVQSEGLRDFAGDFWRQFIAGAKSSVFARDEQKLETVDERIDGEATTHINNYVFKDPIPAAQLSKIKDLFGSYSALFQPVGAGGFEQGITYKTMVGWLNNLNRKVKNHIVLRPKQDMTRETDAGVNYTLHPNWSTNLAKEYECVKSTVLGNCNPTRGKTNAIAKEFGRSVGNDFSHIGKKFAGSIKKLKQVFSKDFYKGYFDGFGTDWGVGVTINGTKLGAGDARQVKQEPAKVAKEEKERIKETLDECKQDGSQYEIKEKRSILGPLAYNKVIGCKDTVSFEYDGVVLDGMTENEAAKRQRMIANMNDWVAGVTSSNEELDALGAIAAPLDVTPAFQDVSKSLYLAKGTLGDLIGSSIDGCLAYCSNLNGKIQCGSR